MNTTTAKKTSIGWLTLGVCLLVTAATGATSEAAPHDVVRRSADALFEVVDAAKAYADTDRERFFREVERVLAPVVDFEGIARSVMAVYYKQANDEQRARFADTFKWGLVRAYAGALLSVENESYAVLPPDRPPRNPGRQSVKMEVMLANGKVYPVVYSMVDLGKGDWRMRNLIIDGINMGLTYRNQFASAMKEDKAGAGLDGVIDGWAETIATIDVGPDEGDSGAPTEAAGDAS